MSLKIWLPLDGNLNNYGTLTDIAQSAPSPVINNSGKIGKCYECNNSHYVTLTNTLPETYNYTFSFWMKIPSTLSSVGQWNTMFSFRAKDSSANDTISTITMAWASYNNIKIYDSTNHQHLWMVPGTQFNYDTWNHYAITHTGNSSTCTIKIYTDGILRGSYTSSNRLALEPGGIWLGSGINPSYGALSFNDFRIYDECLSPGEVKEISQALVLHYPLDSPNDIIRNKYSGDNADGMCSTGYPTWTRTELSGERGYNYKLTYTGTGNDYWAYLRFPHFTFTVGKRYYYSVKIRCNKCTGGGGLSLRASRSENDWVTGMVTVCSSTLADGKWHEYYMSTIINSTYDRSGTTVTCNPLMEFYTGSLKTSGTVYEFDFDMKDAQVVESDIYVPFIDNGLPQYTIHDCSGYNRNGSITASTCPIISGGSPRNRYCYQFDGSDDYIIANVKQSDILADKKFTVSAWVYPTECTNYRGAFGSHRNYTGFWFAQCSSSGITFCFGTGSAWATYIVDPNYTLNAWTHYAMVYDGSKAIVYKNGAKLGESSGSITLYADDYIWVGKAYQNTDRFWKGKISDVKLYATALSADDISTLYHNFASIYNSGSLASYDMRENI